MASGGSQQCMNCGGPVLDSETDCSTCRLHRSKVIYGEYARWQQCERCGELVRVGQSLCGDCDSSGFPGTNEYFQHTTETWVYPAGESPSATHDHGNNSIGSGRHLTPGQVPKANGCLVVFGSLLISGLLCAWWVPNGGEGFGIILAVAVPVFGAIQYFLRRQSRV